MIQSNCHENNIHLNLVIWTDVWGGDQTQMVTFSCLACISEWFDIFNDYILYLVFPIKDFFLNVYIIYSTTLKEILNYIILMTRDDTISICHRVSMDRQLTRSPESQFKSVFLSWLWHADRPSRSSIPFTFSPLDLSVGWFVSWMTGSKNFDCICLISLINLWSSSFLGVVLYE